MAHRSCDIPWYVNPIDAAAELRRARATCREGDLFELSATDFDDGSDQPWILPAPNIEVLGQGFKTMIRNRYQGTPDGVKPFSCAFECDDHTKFRNLSLIADCGPDEQLPCVGFGQPTRLPHGRNKLTIEHCYLLGLTQCVYDWSNNGNIFEVSDSEVISARWAFCLGGSGGGDSVFYDLWRNKVTIDSSLSNYEGLVGHRVVGIAGRGGRARAWDNIFTLKGDPRMASVRGAWTDGEGSGGWPTNPNGEGPGSVHASVELYNNHFRIDPNGAKDWWDLDNQCLFDGIQAYMYCSVGSGSGTNLGKRAYKSRGPIDFY